MEEKAYCATCRAKVSFESKDAIRKTELEGHIYEYPVKLAICTDCGEIAVYKPYQDSARNAFADSVRQENDLVVLETVQALPKKYKIGKRPLSVLLGWGEVTYSRFSNGLVPSRTYSKIIQDLYGDPKLFMRLLLSNKERITQPAFKKSYKATQNIMDQETAGTSKLISLVNYLKIASSNALEKLGIQKIIYYIQGFSSCLLGEPIIAQTPEAWAYGPVYAEAYYYETTTLDILMDESRGNLELFQDDFSSDELLVIDGVFKAFRPFSDWTLVEMTHREDPWLDARKRAGVGEGAWCKETIPQEDIKTYFANTVKKYGIKSSEDISRYANAKFCEINKIDSKGKHDDYKKNSTRRQCT